MVKRGKKYRKKQNRKKKREKNRVKEKLIFNEKEGGGYSHLNERMSGVDFESFLLVEIVVALHVLGLAVGLRLDDPLHVSGPAEPKI